MTTATDRLALADRESISVIRVAEILRHAPDDTPYALEAQTRHAIRYFLSLVGCSWRRADSMAQQIVARARSANGTPEPQGWDATDDLGIGVLACRICGRPFTIGYARQLYCGKRCRDKAKASFVPPPICTTCARCGRPIDNPRVRVKYCSPQCRTRAIDERYRERNRERLAAARRARRRNPQNP